MLVRAQLRQHTVSIFLSLLGAIWLFGICGLVLGPVIFSAAESLLAIWNHRLNGTTFTFQESGESGEKKVPTECSSLVGCSSRARYGSALLHSTTLPKFELGPRLF